MKYVIKLSEKSGVVQVDTSTGAAYEHAKGNKVPVASRRDGGKKSFRSER